MTIQAQRCCRSMAPKIQGKFRHRASNYLRSGNLAMSCVWLLLLMTVTSVETLMHNDSGDPRLANQLEKRLLLQASVDRYSLDKSESPRQRRQEVNPKVPENTEARAELSSNTKVPQRVRIAPFDLLLMPTPIQLKRADEDLLLVDLQELIILYMKTQFGNEGSITNRMGTDTTLEYVLFSDIEANSWTEGGEGSQDPPRTVLRLNGGVASFLGPDIPSVEEVNQWVESAINGLFVAALGETQYNYVELTQYMITDDSNGVVYSGDLAVSYPSKTTNSPRPVKQAAQKPPTTTSRDSAQEFPLFHVLVSLLVAFAAIAVFLAFWIRRNNRAVRVLCLNGKEREEIIDFSDDAPISISHEHNGVRRNVVEEVEEDDDDSRTEANELRKDSLVAVEASSANERQNEISLATQCNVDEASVHSSTSEFTIPTVSALSFRNPNPFGKALVPQESFQNERKTYLSKDMLYSSWSGKPPSLEHGYGRRHDDSVLQPSYFSAAKEWEHISKLTASSRTQDMVSRDLKETSKEPRGFRFFAAHEASRPETEDTTDGIYMVDKSRSSRSSSGMPGRRGEGPKRNQRALSDTIV